MDKKIFLVDQFFKILKILKLWKYFVCKIKGGVKSVWYPKIGSIVKEKGGFG